jgi:hypothetical protein
LTESEGVELVAAASGFAGALYPVANPSPALAGFYAQALDIAAACVECLPTLKRTLAVLAAGMPALR